MIQLGHPYLTTQSLILLPTLTKLTGPEQIHLLISPSHSSLSLSGVVSFDVSIIADWSHLKGVHCASDP